MPDDPVCHSEACAGRCARSEHAMQFATPSWTYGRCRTHRGCQRFADVEPLAPGPLEPLTAVERDAIGGRMDRAREVLAEAALIEDDEDAWMRSHEPTCGLVLSAGYHGPCDCKAGLERVEAPVEAAPIESYDAWRCTSCFSRSLKPGRCCKRSMQAIRMVMYAREVPDA